MMSTRRFKCITMNTPFNIFKHFLTKTNETNNNKRVLKQTSERSSFEGGFACLSSALAIASFFSFSVQSGTQSLDAKEDVKRAIIKAHNIKRQSSKNKNTKTRPKKEFGTPQGTNSKNRFPIEHAN